MITRWVWKYLYKKVFLRSNEFVSWRNCETDILCVLITIIFVAVANLKSQFCDIVCLFSNFLNWYNKCTFNVNKYNFYTEKNLSESYVKITG